MDECCKPEDLQFLKCSPCKDIHGVYRPVLNLGVLLRLSGTCKGDLPGRGDWTKRAAKFQGSLLHGYMTCARWPMLDAMRKRYPLEKINGVYQFEKHEELDWKMNGGGNFTDAAVLARYDLSDIEVEDVSKFFNETNIGQTIGNDGLSKILAKDYGLKCNQYYSSVIDPNPVYQTLN